MPTGGRAQTAANPVRRPRQPTASAVVLALVALIMLSPSCAAAAMEENQIELLRKFKTALTNSDPALSEWNTSPNPPCLGNAGQWRGVICFDGNVRGLQLENMALGGQIDVDSLAPLRFFRTLSLMGNNFAGAMPDWRKIGALKALYLSNNKFVGNIPDDAFKGMNSLKKIYLANNGFTGPIPTSLESPKLIELRLENNKFTGKIPDISSENLKVFNVSNNLLAGPIPEHLRRLDPSSFAGNAGICGKPLENSCTDVPPDDLPSPSPPNSPPSGNKSSGGKIVIIILCILIGLLLLILLTFILLRTRRNSPLVETVHDDASSTLAVASGSTTEVAPSAQVSEPPIVAAAAVRKGEQTTSGKLTFVREDDKDRFGLQDLLRASAEVLGSGTFGASYKAVLVDGEAVVVKRFKQMNTIGKEDFHEHMRRLGRLRQTNLLPLVAYLYRKEEKLLVSDYIGNGSLAKHLHGKHSPELPGLSWPTRLGIVKGIAKGMAYLHNELPSLTLPHGHLKSSNVLLDESFRPVLSDYTLIPVVNPSQVHSILVGYKAPEYARNCRVSRKTDVWCLGILILEILTGKFVIAQGCGHNGANLAGWITAIVHEVGGGGAKAFDKEMKVTSEACREEMEKLLQIGIACCEEDIDVRMDMEEAVKRIGEVQEWS